jgi:tetratricopeptide (TPR) repeat protein
MTGTRRIGRYEIVEEIGRGGFATVYRARDPGLDQAVALKVLHGSYAGRPKVVQRFLEEARKTVRLRHRSIVRIFAVDEADGVPYIAMEYLPGGTLADRLSGEPLPLDAVTAVVEQVAEALDYAHQRELIHRDVKPGNILFAEEGHAVLVDFGLVKSLSESGLTTVGTSLGTPAYMAPEQVTMAAEIDVRADVYALGLVTFEMLTGRVPFEAETPLAVINAHVNESPPDPCAINQKLDPAVAEVVLKTLEKAPDDRYRSAGTFARALREVRAAAQRTTETETTLETLYAEAQEAVKARQWGLVVSLCVEMRNLNPDYRDVGTLLTMAAGRLAEDEEQRQQQKVWGDDYAAALALLDDGQYSEAIARLEALPADFEDVQARLEQARTQQKQEALYQDALEKLAADTPDAACADLLALLEIAPDHADIQPLLVQATTGMVKQVRELRTKLEQAGVDRQAMEARLSEREEQLDRAQVALQSARSTIEAYDSLLLALEERDREQMETLAHDLKADGRARVARLLEHLQEKPDLPYDREGDLIAWKKDGKEMVRVPAGPFLYGDEKEERELPEFWIDRAPVTNVEYARFVTETGYDPPSHWDGRRPTPGISHHPVVNVSWYDARAYADWAGKRLPTEEEWEKAARGTRGQEYPWGNEKPTPQLCNFDKNEGGTTPVARYSPQGDSPYGCVDMAGNVWEWTASKHSIGGQVLKGGAFYDDEANVRCAYRLRYMQHYQGSDDGFRLVAVPGVGYSTV